MLRSWMASELKKIGQYITGAHLRERLAFISQPPVVRNHLGTKYT